MRHDVSFFINVLADDVVFSHGTGLVQHRPRRCALLRWAWDCFHWDRSLAAWRRRCLRKESDESEPWRCTFLGWRTIPLSFGWAFYRPDGLKPFVAVLFFLGLFGGAIFSLWLPEQYGTSVRATAFAFTTSFGRFMAAGMNFGIGGLVGRMGTLGIPVALTAIAFWK